MIAISTDRPVSEASLLRHWSRHIAAIILLLALLRPSATAFEPATPEDAAAAELALTTDQLVILPQPIADPIEPVNRGLWEVNMGLMRGVIKPTSKAYRVAIPKAIRTGIRNVGRNLGYPRRLANNLLQEKWTGARDETYRFFANSVLGLAGFFDVASNKWNIPEWQADFGQTLGTWGWHPHIYLMLPIAGPSNERDALGSVVDGFLNPLSYFPPYAYIPYGITYNNLTDTVDAYVRASKTDFDPYYVLRYAWTLKRESKPVELDFDGEQHTPSIDTLQTVFFTFTDPDLPELGETRSVSIPGNKKKLPYTYWVQDDPAPLIYIIPGLGSHRLSSGALGLAELFYRNGFSVVTISSAYNYEFMERGASVPVPGYTPVDVSDMQAALAEIDQDFRAKNPGKITGRGLLGYSMGGFHALEIAARQITNKAPLVHFDRFLAINPPVRLDYAIQTLDGYFRAALEWPADVRTERIEQLVHKVATLAQNLDELTPESVIPLSATESKFLIGLAFRLNLRDIIFNSQLRTNMGVLEQPLSTWRREPVYREILQLGFEEYLKKFVTPYYSTRGINLEDAEIFGSAVSLAARENAFTKNRKVRVIANANDMLISEGDLAWIRETFEDQAVIFERGGHLGNLSHPAVQAEILEGFLPLEPLEGEVIISAP